MLPWEGDFYPARGCQMDPGVDAPVLSAYSCIYAGLDWGTEAREPVRTYRTAEVARAAGIHRDTLLRWLRQGRVSEPTRNAYGWRQFNEEQKNRIVETASRAGLSGARAIREGKQDYLAGGTSRLRRLDWDFATAKTNYLTHAVHPYPAKFIPQIPNALIQELSAVGETVLDPFCGSGTTLVEALRLGRNAVGVDANPLACLISRAKTSSIDALESASLEGLAAECARRGATKDNGTLPLFPPAIPDSRSYVPFPDPKEIERWFPREVIEDLAEIKALCMELGSERARLLARVAFSSIIVGVSYQDSETRYVRRDKGIKAGESFRRFSSALSELSRKAAEFTEEIDPAFRVSVIEGNVLERPDVGPVELVVCSPPYPNAFSYHLYHRTRMVWLDMDYRTFKRDEIGSHRKYSARGANGATAETFEQEMQIVFGWIGEHLRKDHMACFVVGDSTIRGDKVRNDELLVRAAQSRGFQVEARLARRMQDARKSFNPSIGKIKEEKILILRSAGI